MAATSETARWTGLDERRAVLRRFLRGQCRDESEIDDVVQETLLRAARYRSSLDDGRRLESWMVRIAANILRDHRRRESRRGRHESGEECLEGLVGREPLPGGTTEERQYRVGGQRVGQDLAERHLRGALGSLRDDDRRVLDSYYGGAGSCRETAVECDIDPALVKVRLFRARRRLLLLMRRRLAIDLALEGARGRGVEGGGRR